ncbi:hypothetical protein OB955_17215 [Halobacteria archaeon AArc-m2/3/4]|uniref:Uncharacterized protein n=1 Tax=Natronoglomus mannanivorans TaxID=2979990 RepID=A0ABT2QHP9_9EURY|nr:hypothetical protein [Halobacteria archaeon AArc-m2/3/4]
MSNTIDVALMLLQLVALTIPPVVVLIQLLKQSENLEWEFRKLSFGLVFSSVALLIGGALAILLYFITSLALPMSVVGALVLVIAGLLPLVLFVGVLYHEHRQEYGP